MNDEDFMNRAIQLAYSNLGNVSPRPSVGAVVVKEGKVIGEGVTQQEPDNHAEIEAMKNNVEGATLYVTLEPCSYEHHTPPCVDKIIEKGIKKVVIGTVDKNPLVNGKGIQKLKDAGIEVEFTSEKEAEKCHEFFFKYVTTHRPFVTIKAAMTIDGSVTWGDGVRKKITGNEADKAAHVLRRRYDAILVGVHTLLKDDPQLTTRLVEGNNPLRVVLDSTLNIPLDAALLKQEGKTIVFCLDKADKEKKEKLEKLCDVVVVNEKYGMVDAEGVLEELGKRNVTSLLIEGGAKVIASFLNDKAVDKGVFFIAPFIVEKGMNLFEVLKGKVIIRKDLSVYKEGEDLMVEGYL